MSAEYVSVKDLAAELGKHRAPMLRRIRREGIEVHMRRLPDSRGKAASCVTPKQAEAVRQMYEGEVVVNAEPDTSGCGVLYVVQLLPKLDPQRVKIGFTQNIEMRLADFRTTVPDVKLVQSWPCKRTWESMVTDILVSVDCAHVGGEVFRCKNLKGMLARADRLFGMCPEVRTAPF
jgi:hypothetical protein